MYQGRKDVDNYFLNIGLYHYLVLSIILFIIGAIGAIICRNVIKILISIEMMISAVNINFIVFASYHDSIKLQGFSFSVFYIAIGAVETAVALLIFYLMYKEKKSIDIDDYRELKG